VVASGRVIVCVERPKRVGLLYYVTWLLELGMIQQIKELRAQLHAEALIDMDILHQYHVGIRIVRTVKLISSRIPDMSKEGIAERRQVRCPGSNATRQCINSAQSRLLRCRREAGEVPRPFKDSEVTPKVNRSPRLDFKTSAPAKLRALWAPGYEGSGAVLTDSGSQFGSGSVLGLPSSPASSTAVTGRQNW
jgi:transposase InsO family protein